MKTSEAKGKKVKVGKPAPITHLAATDYRLPITIALDRAFQRGLVTPEQLALWKEELRDLITEAAKTFVGFQNTDALRKALEITLGLLSLTVTRSTKGEEDIDAWADFVATRKLKEMVKDSIAASRKIHSPEGTPYVYLLESDGMERPMKDLLRSFALSRTGQGWTGYELFTRTLGEAGRAQTTDRLARWLLATVLGVKIGAAGDDHPMLDGASTASEVMNTIFYRQCTGLGFAGRRGNKELVLKKEQIRAIREAFEAGKTGWVKAAAERFATLWEGIPADLRVGAGTEDWFEGHLKKGPPKIPKKAELDDVINGVTGVYFYDVYE